MGIAEIHAANFEAFPSQSTHASMSLKYIIYEMKTKLSALWTEDGL